MPAVETNDDIIVTSNLMRGEIQKPSDSEYWVGLALYFVGHYGYMAIVAT